MTEPESPHVFRWNLYHWMFAVALLAVGFAAFGYAGTMLLGLVSLPIWLAPRGRKLRRFYWMLFFYPFLFLFSTQLVRVEHWLTWGHPPQSLFLAWFGHFPIVAAEFLVLVLIFGSPLAVSTSVLLWLFRVGDPSRAESPSFAQNCELFLLPLFWFPCCGLAFTSVP
jgi:hypothetical protein